MCCCVLMKWVEECVPLMVDKAHSLHVLHSSSLMKQYEGACKGCQLVFIMMCSVPRGCGMLQSHLLGLHMW
jgi:hypothetical protein